MYISFGAMDNNLLLLLNCNQQQKSAIKTNDI